MGAAYDLEAETLKITDVFSEIEVSPKVRWASGLVLGVGSIAPLVRFPWGRVLYAIFGSPCEFVGLLPWFDPPRHDTVIQYQYQHKDDHRLGMGSNTYPSESASLLGNHKDVSLADVPVEQLRKLMPLLLSSQRANIGIAVAPTTDAARGASDIHLTKP
ncbi:hypothetical protein Bca52824_080663 [Brassica carinata]|uniref:Uncharacterized protein n=1 Tax=Brassica carinata TaxID=52824 RepID=A0A8X7PGZ9_BRACI|nr:hypothetical protein Bca52824_080663 [Brassica carinata]